MAKKGQDDYDDANELYLLFMYITPFQSHAEMLWTELLLGFWHLSSWVGVGLLPALAGCRCCCISKCACWCSQLFLSLWSVHSSQPLVFWNSSCHISPPVTLSKLVLAFSKLALSLVPLISPVLISFSNECFLLIQPQSYLGVGCFFCSWSTGLVQLIWLLQNPGGKVKKKEVRGLHKLW